MSGGHTPGRWYVPDRGYGWDHFAAIVTETGMVATCHIAGLSRSYEQTAADARLIAAAPDMLEALIAAESLFNHTFAMDGTIHKQIRAAIARTKKGEAE